jgi:hypothetical protein
LLGSDLLFDVRSPRRFWSPSLLAVALLVAAAYPRAARWREGRRLERLLDRAALAAASVTGDGAAVSERSAMDGAGANDPTLAPTLAPALANDPALMVRVAELGPLLASWQTVGGCGAGAATGGGAGIKWIGRGVRGGLFNVLEQGSYTETRIGLQGHGHLEQHMIETTLITVDIGEKWNVGATLPLVYKYLQDPRNDPLNPANVSNGGLGDVSAQVTRKFGRINDTMLTAVVGFPTGTYDAQYKGRLLEQHQQLGFGKFTGSLLIDHTLDRVWGLMVAGALASYRGGENSVQSYRAPSATGYYYAGFYVGPFVPAIGVSMTGFTGHDRSVNEEAATALFSVAANASIEWSTDYFAVLVGASVPYQYDGFNHQPGDTGNPKSPWGLGSWIVGLGLAASPF